MVYRKPNLYQEKYENTNVVIRSRNSTIGMQYNGQKSKPWSTKHYTEYKRLSNTIPTKHYTEYKRLGNTIPTKHYTEYKRLSNTILQNTTQNTKDWVTQSYKTPGVNSGVLERSIRQTIAIAMEFEG